MNAHLTALLSVLRKKDTSTIPQNPVQLSAEQSEAFQRDGYIILPSFFDSTTLAQIVHHFATVMEANRNRLQTPVQRNNGISHFLDKSPELAALLLDDPRIQQIARDLVGTDYIHIGSDAHFYQSNTRWHSDYYHKYNTYLKFMMYLDPVTPETGCLRVVPGSHVYTEKEAETRDDLRHSTETMTPSYCPNHVSVPTVPGDLVIFNHNLLHASFGGAPDRRALAFNMCSRPRTDQERDDVQAFLARQYGDCTGVWESGGEERRKHLDLVKQLQLR
ncbi:hypothetical protein HDV00_012740 [Rhizophlyctis rosea]|nr:hypothetical protein HDV00_012740 [Rhizophlyctis rosea]